MPSYIWRYYNVVWTTITTLKVKKRRNAHPDQHKGASSVNILYRISNINIHIATIYNNNKNFFIFIQYFVCNVIFETIFFVVGSCFTAGRFFEWPAASQQKWAQQSSKYAGWLRQASYFFLLKRLRYADKKKYIFFYIAMLATKYVYVNWIGKSYALYTNISKYKFLLTCLSNLVCKFCKLSELRRTYYACAYSDSLRRNNIDKHFVQHYESVRHSLRIMLSSFIDKVIFKIYNSKIVNSIVATTLLRSNSGAYPKDKQARSDGIFFSCRAASSKKIFFCSEVCAAMLHNLSAAYFLIPLRGIQQKNMLCYALCLFTSLLILIRKIWIWLFINNFSISHSSCLTAILLYIRCCVWNTLLGCIFLYITIYSNSSILCIYLYQICFIIFINIYLINITYNLIKNKQLKKKYPGLYYIFRFLLLSMLFISLITMLILFFLLMNYLMHLTWNIILIKIKEIFTQKSLGLKTSSINFNKPPKKPENPNTSFFFFDKQPKEHKDIKKKALNMKEKILKIQNEKLITDNLSSVDCISKSISNSKKWKQKINIDELAPQDLSLKEKLEKIQFELDAYTNQKKKFKQSINNIKKGKENFYPDEAKYLWKDYIEVIKILKSNLKSMKKNLKKNK
nr:hypothetical protein [Ophiocordyceps sp.]